MSRERIASVVLAAGVSSRMGRNKLFIELGGRSMLRRVATTAVEAGLDPLLVVVGHERERVQAELADLPHTAVFNADYASGMNTSLRAGFRAISDEHDGAIVLLADMPFVTTAMVRTLADRFREGEEPLVVSTYGEVVAPPILYGRSLFDELRALEGDGCGKGIIKRHRQQAVEVAWPASALADLDHPEDVDRARLVVEAR
jgi:molybdenum cofactor cytidylyltransferase